MIQKIEKIAKEGPEAPSEPFPELDPSQEPIIINAVDITSLTATETAYYFATTATSIALPGAYSRGGSEPGKTSEEGRKVRHAQRAKDKKAKRREPEGSGEESNGGESGHEVQREEKGRNDEEEPCTVCNREYEEGDKMIQCDGNCKKWYHIECAKLSLDEFDRLSKDKKGVWKCTYCSKGLPAPSQCKLTAVKSTAETGRKKRKVNYK